MENDTVTKNQVSALLELEGEDAKRFNKVKEARGVKNNVELLRILIKEAYDDLIQIVVAEPAKKEA